MGIYCVYPLWNRLCHSWLWFFACIYIMSCSVTIYLPVLLCEGFLHKVFISMILFNTQLRDIQLIETSLKTGPRHLWCSQPCQKTSHLQARHSMSLLSLVMVAKTSYGNIATSKIAMISIRWFFFIPVLNASLPWYVLVKYILYTWIQLGVGYFKGWFLINNTNTGKP